VLGVLAVRHLQAQVDQLDKILYLALLHLRVVAMAVAVVLLD
jgi:hypothetical protein